MSISRTKVFSLLAFCFLQVNCGSSGKQASSEVKYGFLAKSRHFLINLPSNSTIKICGDSYFDQVKSAILKWAKPINRTFNIVKSCTSPKIKIVKYTGARCRNDIGMRAFYDQDPLVLQDCDTPNYWLKDNMILHEVGHFWGLCDMYQGGVNCAYISNKSQLKLDSYKSVMRYSQLSDHLLPDDIAGIKVLAKNYP